MIENNICLLTDSYKVTHHYFYPKGTEKIYSYLESRVGAEFNKTIFYGLQYIIKKYLEGLKLSKSKQMIADMIFKELEKRLQFLIDVGLDYLTLSRPAGTLSGGEAQRIRLATQIGSGLTGVMYILDEPSIGLHQRDNSKLIDTMKKMRDLGNTLIVVEHDEDTMYAADQIIDIGPGPGVHGGNVIAQGTAEEIKKVDESITGRYLAGKEKIEVPKKRRKSNGHYNSG